MYYVFCVSICYISAWFLAIIMIIYNKLLVKIKTLVLYITKWMQRDN